MTTINEICEECLNRDGFECGLNFPQINDLSLNGCIARVTQRDVDSAIDLLPSSMTK